MNTDWDATHKTLALRAAGVTLGLWGIVMTVVAIMTHSLHSTMAASMSYAAGATFVGVAFLAMDSARSAVLVRAESRDARSGNRPR